MSSAHSDTAPQTDARFSTQQPRQSGEQSPWAMVLGIALGLAAMIGILVTAFAWPATETQPRDLPIAVVGEPEATTAIEQQLDAAVPDGFTVVTATDATTAEQLIEDREVYGAIITEPQGSPRFVIASAASPAVAQTLEMLATEMGNEESGADVPVDDIAPFTASDPRGAGFSAAALPMVMGGMIIGVAMSMAISGVWRRVGGVLVAAAAAGLVVGLVAQSWLGSLNGPYWINAAAVALTIAAIALALVGLHSLIGRAGIGLGAALMFLIGNPFSGVASAPEMLPSGWGALGQLLPPGAGGNLLRSTSFFDGAAAGAPSMVLGAWVATGLLLATLGWAAGRRRPRTEA